MKITGASLASATMALLAQKSEHITRARISKRTLRKLAGRTEYANLSTKFIEEWIDALEDFYGYTAFEMGDHFGIIKTSAVDQWTRIGYFEEIHAIIQEVQE